MIRAASSATVKPRHLNSTARNGGVKICWKAWIAAASMAGCSNFGGGEYSGRPGQYQSGRAKGGRPSMAEPSYDVVGIGNAIVDIIARCDDAFLSKHDLA